LDTINVKAQLTLYPTEKGGRKTGIKTGYRPNHVFEYKENGTEFKAGYMGKVTFNENEILKPNQTKIVIVEFISEQNLEKYIEIGKIWWIHEGGKKVGEAKINEVLTG
jgi:translation elongation factor EF-Tu-like GTPase